MNSLDKAKILLKYGVDLASATEIWRICNIALLLLGGPGRGGIDEAYVERIIGLYVDESVSPCKE